MQQKHNDILVTYAFAVLHKKYLKIFPFTSLRKKHILDRRKGYFVKDEAI